jgi:hypothetical protein
MGVETNGDKGSVLYRVTKQPLFGKLLMRSGLTGLQAIQEQEAQEFTQQDVLEEKVFYLQTNMSSPSDVFVATIQHTKQPDVTIQDLSFE